MHCLLNLNFPAAASFVTPTPHPLNLLLNIYLHLSFFNFTLVKRLQFKIFNHQNPTTNFIPRPLDLIPPKQILHSSHNPQFQYLLNKIYFSFYFVPSKIRHLFLTITICQFDLEPRWSKFTFFWKSKNISIGKCQSSNGQHSYLLKNEHSYDRSLRTRYEFHAPFFKSTKTNGQ